MGQIDREALEPENRFIYIEIDDGVILEFDRLKKPTTGDRVVIVRGDEFLIDHFDPTRKDFHAFRATSTLENVTVATQCRLIVVSSK